METRGKSCLFGMTLFLGAIIGAVHMQRTLRIPKTSFSCQGRGSGYYADLETGCQIYHMCDGLGRQFSYSCPNTTLFQQRMLICDHWYMVNCSASERDYSANLLIGQRDKPFVSDNEDHQRTPRPDILTVPYAQGFNYYGNNFPITTGSGSDKNVDNSIANGNNDLTDEVPQFSVPTHWSTELTNLNKYTTPNPVTKTEGTGFTGRPIIVTSPGDADVRSDINEQISKNSGNNRFISNKNKQKLNQNDNSKLNPDIISNHGNVGVIVNPPSELFQPPFISQNSQQRASSTTVRSISSFNNQFISKGSQEDVSKNSQEAQINFSGPSGNEEPFTNFIKRFNPNEEPTQNSNEQVDSSTPQSDSQQPISTGFEIQSSSETAGFVPISTSNNHIPNIPTKAVQGKILNNNPSSNVNETPEIFKEIDNENNGNVNFIDNNGIPQPARDLLPPKTEFSEIVSTTMGPPIYYEWKWAAPAFDLEPPSPVDESIQKKDTNAVKKEGRPDFALPRSTTEKPDLEPTQRSLSDQNASQDTSNYKLAPYFIPDYVFPLDKQHPGYDEDGALTSFQVRIPQSAENENEPHPYYGENAQCPQCHPSFVKPGTCTPCVMIRR